MFIVVSLLLSLAIPERQDTNCVNVINLSDFVKKKEFNTKKEDLNSYQKIPTKLIKIN